MPYSITPGSRWPYLSLAAGKVPSASVAEERGEVVVRAELALGENGLGRLSRLSQRHDRIAAGW